MSSTLEQIYRLALAGDMLGEYKYPTIRKLVTYLEQGIELKQRQPGATILGVKDA